jgi:hypothetical protein
MLGVSPDTRVALYVGASWIALLAITYRIFSVRARLQVEAHS